MTIFDDRYGTSSGGTLVPDQLRQMMLKRALTGVGLTTAPVVPPVVPPPISVAPPTPVRTVPIQPTDPIRTDVIPSPGGPATDPTAPPYNLYPYGKPPAVPAADPTLAPPMPVVAKPPVTPQFPTDTAPAVPYTNPNVEAGPGGVTINSIPAAPGWAGTVGMPMSPEEAKGFDKGGKYEKLMAGLDEVAKGVRPKPMVDPSASAITPMSTQPNQPNQLAYQLMAAMMTNRGGNRGLTLTGR